MARRGASGKGGGKGRSGKGARSARPPTHRHYPRTARLNALLTEIVADYFELIEQDDLGFLTVTGVEVDSDLNVAQVFFSIFDDSGENDQEILDALFEHRKRVQRAIASQAKLRKTPDVVFEFDPAVRAGAKIDSLLANLGPIQSEFDEDPASAPGATSPAGPEAVPEPEPASESDGAE